MKLILGSTSPARKELLARLRIPFDIVAPNIEEIRLKGELPYDMALRLAIAKAQAVGKDIATSLIIGCDQVLYMGDEIFGKPGNHQQAVNQLTKMGGQKVISLTGLCLLNTATQQMQTTVERYEVYFRQLSAEMIENYLRLDQPYHCAGSIRAEGLGIVLFERLAGDDLTALIGLPLIKLIKFLENDNFSIIPNK